MLLTMAALHQAMNTKTHECAVPVLKALLLKQRTLVTEVRSDRLCRELDLVLPEPLELPGSNAHGA
jgi:hypothetical protein